MAVLSPPRMSTIGYMTESMIFSLLDQWWYSQSILNHSIALYALSVETETNVRSSDANSESATAAVAEETDVSFSEANPSIALYALSVETETSVRSSYANSESATAALAEETDVSFSKANNGSAFVSLAEQEIVVRSSEAYSASETISLAEGTQPIDDHHIICEDWNSNETGSDSVEQFEPISSQRIDEHADGLTSGEELRRTEAEGQELQAFDGKKVHTNYVVTEIAGDGRCLFRAVAHGSSLRRGNGALDENQQRELADDLRNKVADELVTRRSETEWFIEGDFDVYVNSMRQPEVWGGEPELLMLSHVLKMPITVYMADTIKNGGLIAICEYGQEYGLETPIGVLYHGQGHYEAVQILSDPVATSKL